jgi:hypothetical protein
MRIFLLFFTLFFLNDYLSTWAQEKNFKISIKEDDVRISWTDNNRDVSFYELERKSAQMNTWRPIYKMYTADKNSFVVVDKNLYYEKYFYRLKSVYKDNSVKYSQVVEADLNRPAMFRLNQNYPNPFNPGTVINYSIPEAGFVDLRVYNLLGQEVQSLVSEFQEAGEHSVMFNADELNSGLYIYKLISKDNVLTRKMTLIK